MSGYSRQSVADIIPNNVITAAPLNAEFNTLRDAFAFATGHKHDGSSTEGAYIPLIADTDANNKIEVDSSNNRFGVFVEVSSAAVEQIRFQDGVILPVTDNDIDLGSSALEFKDLYLDGIATIDTLTVDENATIAGTLDVTGATTLGSTLDVTSNTTIGGTADITGNTTIGGTADITGNTTIGGTAGISGNTTVGGTLGVTGATTLSGNTTVGGTLGVSGNTTVGGTLGVTGAVTASAGVTGNLTGNVTASSGTSTFNDLVVSGTFTAGGFEQKYLGAFAEDPTQDQNGDPLEDGDVYFNTETDTLRVYSETLSQWVDVSSTVNGTSQRQTYTATSGQTTFNITYDVGFVDVYLNGVKLLIETDFTATSGTDIVLTTGAASGDIVDIIAFGIFRIADTYTQAEADARFASRLSQDYGLITGAVDDTNDYGALA